MNGSFAEYVALVVAMAGIGSVVCVVQLFTSRRSRMARRLFDKFGAKK